MINVLDFGSSHLHFSIPKHCARYSSDYGISICCVYLRNIADRITQIVSMSDMSKWQTSKDVKVGLEQILREQRRIMIILNFANIKRLQENIITNTSCVQLTHNQDWLENRCAQHHG
ncbi:uncharacterized protein LOC112494286 [Cephus cinctus]|uniref:Uncharacterized protein LOC112494286 n=1 Tax=Cephus cinctus TaxID=211228 RepID=A0AAJ7W0S2_CEPCN|nr:uncharacterized protein LOC112494286 [Cephus cinctus]